jgi:hypothetical protein
MRSNSWDKALRSLSEHLVSKDKLQAHLRTEHAQ